MDGPASGGGRGGRRLGLEVVGLSVGLRVVGLSVGLEVGSLDAVVSPADLVGSEIGIWPLLPQADRPSASIRATGRARA